jgi:hypothetical protein
MAKKDVTTLKQELKELFVNRFVLSGFSIRNVPILFLLFGQIFPGPALLQSLPLLLSCSSKYM